MKIFDERKTIIGYLEIDDENLKENTSSNVNYACAIERWRPLNRQKRPRGNRDGGNRNKIKKILRPLNQTN